MGLRLCSGYTDVRDFDALVQHIRDVEKVMDKMIGTIQQQESRLAEFTTARNGSGMQLAPLHIEAPPTSRSPRMVTDNGRPAASRRTTETFLQGDQDLLPPSPRAAPFAHNQDISGQRIDSSALRPCSMSRSPRPMAEDSRGVDHYVRPLWENSDMLRDVQSEEEEKREQTRNFAEVSRAPSLADHHAALILEDLAFDRTSNVERQNPENNSKYSSFEKLSPFLKRCFFNISGSRCSSYPFLGCYGPDRTIRQKWLVLDENCDYTGSPCASRDTEN
jgi:hypothetical protein